MTPINEDWLKEKGFEKLGKFDHYRLEIKLPYPGERWIEASTVPRKWMACYEVNKIAVSRVMYYTEEIEALIKALAAS